MVSRETLQALFKLARQNRRMTLNNLKKRFLQIAETLRLKPEQRL